MTNKTIGDRPAFETEVTDAVILRALDAAYDEITLGLDTYLGRRQLAEAVAVYAAAISDGFPASSTDVREIAGNFAYMQNRILEIAKSEGW